MSNRPDNQRPYVTPTPANEERRITDIRERSGTHTEHLLDSRGRGYLTDMQGNVGPLMLFSVAMLVTVYRIVMGTPFPVALAIIGFVSASGAFALSIVKSVLQYRTAALLDYVDEAKFRRMSIWMHTIEAFFIIAWLNWLTDLLPLSSAISGSITFAAIAIAVAVRVWRARLSRRRQLWER